MQFETLQISNSPGILKVVFSTPKGSNCITLQFLREMHSVLDLAETDLTCKMISLEGTNGIFSVGMDMEEAKGEEPSSMAAAKRAAESFVGLLRRFTSIPRVVISKVDGSVMGGGIGIVAASDLVIASERSRFALPEALWGIVPCCVMPFLIRRIGFQSAYAMALTTFPKTAQEAERARLADIVANDVDAVSSKYADRIQKIQARTILDLKGFFAKLHGLPAAAEQVAIDEFTRIITLDEVKTSIARYVKERKFPWEP